MPCSEAGGPPRGRGIGVGVEVGSGPGGLGPWGRTWQPLRLWERSCSLAWAASGRLRLHSLWGTWVFRGVSPGWSEVGSQLGWGVCFLIRPFPRAHPRLLSDASLFPQLDWAAFGVMTLPSIGVPLLLWYSSKRKYDTPKARKS